MATRTIPLRTAARRIRLSANETHCPASARVTSALSPPIDQCWYERLNATNAPFSLHAPDDRRLIIAIRVGAQENSITRFDTSGINNAIHDGANVRNGPHFGNGILWYR